LEDEEKKKGITEAGFLMFFFREGKGGKVYISTGGKSLLQRTKYAYFAKMPFSVVPEEKCVLTLGAAMPEKKNKEKRRVRSCGEGGGSEK